ncbi:MAG: hypothetical protein PHR35_00320 [Kiritimatiellae bacterium]|nr:hypothetical protein [Kiritimatiellia bacterium]
MTDEEQIRCQILREASSVREGTGLGYHGNQLANEIACELVHSGLVIGSVDECGNACIAGIRQAGTEYLEEKRPHRRALRIAKRLLFVLYSIALLLIGYVMNLDSVKEFLSELVGRLLK